MINATKIVTAIQELINSDSQVERHQLIELAFSYVDLCESLSKRATHCQELLQKGDRSAAVRKAREEPSLKDMFETATFRELPTWLELCERLDLPLPLLLDTQMIGELVQDLFSLDKGLHRLLRAHRRLAISHAPLKIRLQRLRDIYIADHKNELWTADLLEYEQARIEELVGLATAANKSGNLALLEQMEAELLGDAWLEPPPRKFIQAMHKLIEPHRQAHAAKQYSELVEQLRGAHSSMDDGKCRALLEQCNRVRYDTGFDMEPSLLQEAAAVRSWLDEVDSVEAEHKAYKQVCAELEQAIDGDVDISGLEKLAAAVLRFERDMPSLLAARFHSRIQELRQKHQRLFTLKVIGLAAAILLGFAGVAFFFVSYTRHQEVQRWGTQIAMAIDHDDLKQAKDILDKLQHEHPAIFDSPDIQKHNILLNEKLKEDQRRVTELQDALTFLDRHGVEHFSSVKYVQVANDLAKTSQELTDVKKWRDKLAQHQATLKQDKLDDLKRRQDELWAKQNEAMQAYHQNDERFATLAEESLLMAREQLRLADPTTYFEFHQNATEVQNHVSSLMEAWHKESAQRKVLADQLDDIAGLWHSSAKLAQALTSFASQYPDHELSRDFSTAATMSPNWNAVIEWNALVAQWPQRQVVGQEAQKLLDVLRAYTDRNPSSPAIKSVEEYRLALTVASNAWNNGQLRDLDSINVFLNRPLANDVKMVRMRDGKRYYTLPSITSLAPISISLAGKIKPGIRMQYIINDRCEPSSDAVTIENELLVKPPEAHAPVDTVFEPAPHVALTQELRTLLSRINDSNWATLYLRMAEAVRADTQSDPIYRATLMRVLCNCAYELMPECVPEALPILQSLTDSYVNVSWMDPHDSRANLVRPQIDRTLNSIDGFQPIIDRIAGLINYETPTPEYFPVGVLLPSVNTLHNAGAIGVHKLFVVRTTQDGCVMHEIGTIDEGTIKLNNDSIADVPMGTLLFRSR